MYKGYELGVVYLFDPGYIYWCINEIDNFYIPDLDELKEYGVFYTSLRFEYRMIDEPPSTLNPDIDIFLTFNEYIENIQPGRSKYPLSEETLQKNYSRASTYGDYDKITQKGKNEADPQRVTHTDDLLELRPQWTEEYGNLIYVAAYDLEQELIDRAKARDIENPESNKRLIVCTDQPGSRKKVMHLSVFLGFFKKSGVEPFVKDGNKYILNPKLKARFSSDNLFLEQL